MGRTRAGATIQRNRPATWGNHENAGKGIHCRYRRDPRVRHDRRPRANRSRRGAGSRTVRRRAHVVGRSRSTRHLGLPHDHADGAAAASSAIASSIPTRRSRSSKVGPRGAWSSRPTRTRPANLVHAEYLTDPGPVSRRVTPHVADRRSAERPHAGADGRSARTASAGARAAAPARPAAARTPTPTARCSSAASRAASAGAAVPTLYNNNIRIIQAPGYVAIVHEMVHDTRIVPLDGSPVQQRAQWIGESRGRWEGDTLVVETRNFYGKAPYRGAGDQPASSPNATRASPPTRSTSSYDRGRHQWTQPWTAASADGPAEGDSTNTRATKATTACSTSSRTRATKSGRPRRRRAR